jgi:bacterioferritin-associated ferredoxin
VSEPSGSGPTSWLPDWTYLEEPLEAAEAIDELVEVTGVDDPALTETRLPSRPRYGQLTYTAFAVTSSVRGSGSGGWQVKEEAGDLDGREREALSRQVVTAFRLVTPPSRFPSRDEVAALPRRLTYRRLPLGAVWCHAAPAGNDATGRPNNVFSHVLLDRGPVDDIDLVRPIQRWAATSWLTPYGADEVQAAVLGEAREPVLGDEFGIAELAAFLFDLDASRFSTMGLLLDAVAAALAGGPPVVLGATTTEEGARWIALVQHLTAASVALRISFSTYERLEALLERPPEVVLSVVPASDLAGIRPAVPFPFVLVDPEDDAQTAQAADGTEVWRPRLVGEVATTDWSRLAMDVCLQGPIRWQDCVRDLDEISRQIGWPADAAPAWPLAAAMTRDPAFATARPLAARVLLRDAADVVLPPQIRVPVEAAVAEALTGPAQDVWTAVRELRPRDGRVPELAERAVATYVERALLEGNWLGRPEGVPLPSVRLVTPSEIGRVEEVAARALGSLRTLATLGPGSRAVLFLRVLDFLVRLEDLTGHAVSEADLEDVADTAAFCLMGQQGPAVVEAMRGRDPRLVERVLWRRALHEVATVHELPGRRLPQQVADWFGRHLTLQQLQEAADGDALAVEILVSRCLAEPEPDEDLAVAAAAQLLRPWLPWPTSKTSSVLVEEILDQTNHGRPWTLQMMSGVVDDCGRCDVGMARVMARAVARAVVAEGPSREASELAGRLRDAYGNMRGRGEEQLGGQERARLVIYHRVRPDWHRATDGLSTHVGELLEAISTAWAQLPAAEARSLAPHSVVAGVQAALAMIGINPFPEAADLARRARHLPAVNAPRAALALGLSDALPMLQEMLNESTSALGSQRMGGQVGDLFTRSVMLEAVKSQGFPDNFLLVPFSPRLRETTEQEDLARAVLRDWLSRMARREATDYLAEQMAAVQEGVSGPLDRVAREWLVRWWEPALPQGEDGRRSLRVFRR